MIRMSDLNDRDAERYRMLAGRTIKESRTGITTYMAELIATVEAHDDSLDALRSELKSMLRTMADNNEMIWRLKGEVSDLQKKVLDSAA